MRVEPLGEHAFLIRDLGDRPAYGVAAALREMALEGVCDVACGYDTVGVYLDEPSLGLDELRAALDAASQTPAREPSLHTVPVCYELGEDLPEVAQALRMKMQDVVRLHSGRRYRCYAIGFCPGFPYLGYLPDELSGIPRLAAPRVRVPPGSVGITGRQTGIYPSETPGGWRIIGRTPLCIADPEEAYFPILPGDEAVFEPIDEAEFERLEGGRL